MALWGFAYIPPMTSITTNGWYTTGIYALSLHSIPDNIR
tara:strand:+ start:403 stop:519 length:117 start_codon:yes stop_codon:yes gene_type:complete